MNWMDFFSGGAAYVPVKVNEYDDKVVLACDKIWRYLRTYMLEPRKTYICSSSQALRQS